MGTTLTNPTHEALEIPLLGIVLGAGETRDLGDIDDDTASLLRGHGLLQVAGLPNELPAEPDPTAESPAAPSGAFAGWPVHVPGEGVQPFAPPAAAPVPTASPAEAPAAPPEPGVAQ